MPCTPRARPTVWRPFEDMGDALVIDVRRAGVYEKPAP
jgi:hypothetical protein